MVKHLSYAEREALVEAMKTAHAKTTTEIAVVVAKASDSYRPVTFIFGLAVGCMAALALALLHVTRDFVLLLPVEFIAASLIYALPFMRRLSLMFAPKRYLQHMAAQRAAVEYVHLSHHHPVTKPFVLMFISLTERYVHIYANPSVRARIADKEWTAVIAALTGSIRKDGKGVALPKAVEHAAEMLAKHFPI